MGNEGRFSNMGHDPQGRPIPVHAKVNPQYGRGALLGLAVGDALGTTLEFSRPRAPAFPELARGPHRGITGGGPFGLRRGQVTDDTQMAACLAASLMACGGLQVEDLGQRYVTWLQHAFDVGGQTRSALGLIAAGVHPDEAGLRVWQQNDRRPAGNGSLMRTVPLGLFYAPLEGLVQASMRESAVTHFDPRCQLACAGFNAAVAAAAHGMKPPPEMLAAAIEAIGQGAELLLAAHPAEQPAIDAARAALLSDMRAATDDDPGLYEKDLHLLDHQGFVRVALRLSFWHLLHSESFEAALIDTVNRGGDSDTNGAITGALLGAALGEDQIPEGWKQLVLEALQEDPERPLASDYHPLRLLQLIES